MTYCFDIDGTICSNTEGSYKEASPYNDIIGKINKLYYEGNIIYFFTARGSTTGIDWRDTTENQLNNWDVKYHKLFFGKPSADIYIDDKCINISDWEDTK